MLQAQIGKGFQPEDGVDRLTLAQPFSKGHPLPWQLHKHQTLSPRVNLQGNSEGAIYEASARDYASVQQNPTAEIFIAPGKLKE